MNIGDVIDGKYVVERKLGQGGMGTVLAARHHLLGTPVAIKVLANTSPDHARRFVREARNAGKLRGPHVPQVLHVGVHGEKPYMVLEHVDGVDLGTILEQGPLAPHLACGYIVQACEGLAEVHALGMVHRDIKPSNLMLTYAGVVKLLDFGIATAAAGEPDMQLTSENDVLGSPNYMSPEQLRSTHDVDPRSDVWSLGVTLYELISGRLPFEGRTFAAITIAAVTEPHPPLCEASRELAAIVDRCLAKNRAERFQSADELAAALAPFAHDRTRGLPAYLGAKPRPSPVDHQRAIIPQPALVLPRTSRPQCAYPPGQSLAWAPETELDEDLTAVNVEITSVTRTSVDVRASATRVHAGARAPSVVAQAERDHEAWSMSLDGDDVGISNLAWSGRDPTWSHDADWRPTADVVDPQLGRTTLDALDAVIDGIVDPDGRTAPHTAQPRPEPRAHKPSPVLHARTMPLGKSPRLGAVITGVAPTVAQAAALAPTPAAGTPQVTEWAAGTPAKPQPMRFARRAQTHEVVVPLAAAPKSPPKSVALRPPGARWPSGTSSEAAPVKPVADESPTVPAETFAALATPVPPPPKPADATETPTVTAEDFAALATASPSAFSQRTYSHLSLLPPELAQRARRPTPEIRAPRPAQPAEIPPVAARLVVAEPPAVAAALPGPPTGTIRLSTAPRAGTIGVAAVVAAVAVIGVAMFATRGDASPVAAASAASSSSSVSTTASASASAVSAVSVTRPATASATMSATPAKAPVLASSPIHAADPLHKRR